MSFVKTPPIVSILSDNGVTSRRTTSFDITSNDTTLDSSTHKAPLRQGLLDLFGSLPVSAFTASTTAGIRVRTHQQG